MNKPNLFKKAIYNFIRRAIESNFIGEYVGIDLADMSKEEGSNKGYILIVIDYYTRKLFTRVLKTKSMKDIETGLKSIFQEMSLIPRNIHSDKEAGLINSNYLKSLGVNIYHTEFLGSPIAERVIRSLKEIIEPLRCKSVARSWKQHVKTSTDFYNNRTHRTIKMSPNEAWNDPNSIKLKDNLEFFYTRNRTGPKSTFNIGDKVLTVRKKSKFEKGYKQRWNKTEYKIKAILLSNPIMYQLNNGKNYYTQQLQKI